MLLACVGSLHAHSNEMDLVMAEPYARGKQRNDFSDASCSQKGFADLTLLSSAVALSLGAVSRLLVPRGSTGVCALQLRAVPPLGCSPAHLPLMDVHKYMYFHTHQRGKGREMPTINLRLGPKICFSPLNVRICVQPLKR